MQTSHPAGTPELIKLYERVTRAFKDEARYTNDPRYLRLWIEYVRGSWLACS